VTYAQIPRFDNGSVLLPDRPIERCGTVDDAPAHLLRAPEDLSAWQRAHPERVNTVVAIPVAVHVIYKSDSTGYIADQLITDQISHLNATYAGSNFTFFLHSITRTLNNTWFTALAKSSTAYAMMQALAIQPAYVLNLYTAAPPGLLGYSSLPWDFAESSYKHGVVLRYSTLPGGGEAGYDEGDTGTHEVGHYLGLYHTFHPDNGTCSTTGDYVADTPQQATPTRDSCPASKDTCPSPGLDPIHNYMDYPPDACMYEFTPLQRARMDWAVATYRPTLGTYTVTTSEPTCIPLGTNGIFSATVWGGQPPFSYSWQYKPICLGPEGGFDVGCDTWSYAGNAALISFGAAMTTDFDMRVTVTDSGARVDTETDYGIEVGNPCPSAPLVEQALVGAAVELQGNYPNPFNPATVLRFRLSEGVPVVLTVYDGLGRVVRHLFQGWMAAGEHVVAFEAGGLPSGLYVYRLQTPMGAETGRMLLLR
jgi:hypothetical protein